MLAMKGVKAAHYQHTYNTYIYSYLLKAIDDFIHVALCDVCTWTEAHSAIYRFMTKWMFLVQGRRGVLFVGWYTIINYYTAFASCSTRGNCASVPSNINRNKLSLIICVFIDIIVGSLTLHRLEWAFCLCVRSLSFANHIIQIYLGWKSRS